MRKQKLENLSDNDIKKLIKTMQKGLSVASAGSEEAKVIQASIDRALEELKRRSSGKNGNAQSKKNEPEKRESESVSQNAETNQERHVDKKPAPGSNVSETPKPSAVLLADTLMKAPPRTIKVQWANGEIREMTDAELRRKAKDNFSDVLKSKFKPDELRRSAQFNNCVIFLIALYQLGDEFPEHLKLHSTYNQCGEAMQNRSVQLYKKLKIYFEAHKDLN